MKHARTFTELYRQMRLRIIPFLLVFFCTILVTYGVLYAVDFIPEAPATTDDAAATKQEKDNQATVKKATAVTNAASLAPKVVPNHDVAAYPERIIFDALDKTVTISNPQSQAISDLDHALLSGAVRYPSSADFTQSGNIFILGHSSYLPNVINKNFQAFNGIQNLSWGDKIRLESADTEYIYRVEKVYKAKASEVVVPVTPGEARLTLATCNSFGSKEDRFIVEASLIGKQER